MALIEIQSVVPKSFQTAFVCGTVHVLLAESSTQDSACNSCSIYPQISRDNIKNGRKQRMTSIL